MVTTRSEGFKMNLSHANKGKSQILVSFRAPTNTSVSFMFKWSSLNLRLSSIFYLFSTLNYLALHKFNPGATKGRTIRKLMGGGGAKYKKKYSRKGKLNEKKFLHANGS